ncbi:MAG TPA: hypothetical protein VME01_10360 [Solirubrobacteraceae bacterium]|nr:hypothetical protein [Solirubrobacteraceae bacterium]
MQEVTKPKKKKRRPLRKLFFLGVVGGGAALAYSKDLRTAVLDKLFGSEKEFSYTPPAGEGPVSTPSDPDAS